MRTRHCRTPSEPRSCRPENDYLILDTLAAANACSGNFANAIDLEEKAITAVPRDLSTPLEQRLAMYEHNKPFTTRSSKEPGADRIPRSARPKRKIWQCPRHLLQTRAEHRRVHRLRPVANFERSDGTASNRAGKSSQALPILQSILTIPIRLSLTASR